MNLLCFTMFTIPRPQCLWRRVLRCMVSLLNSSLGCWWPNILLFQDSRATQSKTRCFASSVSWTQKRQVGETWRWETLFKRLRWIWQCPVIMAMTCLRDLLLNCTSGLVSSRSIPERRQLLSLSTENFLQPLMCSFLANFLNAPFVKEQLTPLRGTGPTRQEVGPSLAKQVRPHIYLDPAAQVYIPGVPHWQLTDI